MSRPGNRVILSPISQKPAHAGNAHVSVLKLGRKIAQGNRREIYSVLGHPSLLINIPSSKSSREEYRRAIMMLKGLYRRSVPLRREVCEYRRIALEPNQYHLQECFGTVETPIGRGLVVGAVTRPDGTLAPTLRELIAAKAVNDAVIRALIDFLDWMITTRLVAADVHPGNIVYDPEHARMVLVDGIGDKTFIPLRAWFPRLNRIYKERLAISILQGVARSLREKQ
jgi:hypothetical protein